MVAVNAGFSLYPSQLFYEVSATEVSADPVTNTSQVNVQARIYLTSGFASSSGGSGTTTPGGWSTGAVNWSVPSSLTVYNNTITVAHNPDGSGSYSFSGTSSMNGWGDAATGTGVLTLTTLNLASGKRWNGSAWTDVTINKRWNGSAWVDLTIKKRWSGTAWTDIP